MRTRIGAAVLMAAALTVHGCGDVEDPISSAPAAKGSKKIGARVGGHWEGAPGGHGEVCVTIGSTTECHPYSTHSGETNIMIPPGQVALASVTVTISDQETGGLVTALDQFTDGNPACENMPVLDVTAFTPCAHPDYLDGPGVKRFNLMINSSAGGPFDPGRGDGGNPDDPAAGA